MAAVRRGLSGSSRYSHGMTSGGSPLLPPGQYIAWLARKRMAAGSRFRDEDGRVLLVDPTYKPTWDLPGGVVEKEESPHAACRREVAEGLGLARVPVRVLVGDWVASRRERAEGARYAFVEPGEVTARVRPLLARRIAACLDAVVAGTVISLEDGCPAT